MDDKFVILNKCDTLSKEDFLFSQCCTYATMNHAMFRIWHRDDYYFIVMTIEQIELLVNEYNNGTIVNFPGYKGNEESFDAIIKSAEQYRVKRLMHG